MWNRYELVGDAKPHIIHIKLFTKHKIKPPPYTIREMEMVSHTTEKDVSNILNDYALICV